MPGKLKDTHNPHNSKDLHYPAHVLELHHAILARFRQEQGDVVRQYGEQVNDVQHAFEELPLVRCRHESEDVLEREPSNADALDGG